MRVEVLLTAVVGLGALSIDMFLPSLPAIAQGFGARPATAQLTLTLFLATPAACGGRSPLTQEDSSESPASRVTGGGVSGEERRRSPLTQEDSPESPASRVTGGGVSGEERRRSPLTQEDSPESPASRVTGGGVS